MDQSSSKYIFYDVCIAALTFITWKEGKEVKILIKILLGEMDFTFAFCLVKHQYGKIHFHFLFGKKSVRQDPLSLSVW